MYKLIPPTLFTLFLITACGGEQTIKKQPEQQIQSKNTDNKKTDERGFDPCLLNANLAVCKNK